MSKATQCAEAIISHIETVNGEGEALVFGDLESVIRRFYPDEETTVSIYRNPPYTVSLRMIDEGRDV